VPDAGALAGVEHLADRRVVAVRVAADVDLGLRILHRDRLELVGQRLVAGDAAVVPERGAVASTEITMFSGLVSRTWLRSLGSATGT
jgi:hypothetical protein